MVSKLENIVRFLFVLNFIHFSTCRMYVNRKETITANSLTECITNIFNNYTNPSDTIALAINQYLDDTADRTLLKILYEKQKWTIYNSLSNLNYDRSITSKINNYLIQIENEDEIKRDLSLLLNQLWNPRAKLVVFSDQSIHNEEFVYYLIFKTLWKNKAINSIVISPQEGNSTIFNIYTWYPYQKGDCGGYKKYVLLDTCENGVFKAGTNLFPTKVPKNLKGCPVKVRTVIWPPYVIAPARINPYQTTINLTEGLDIQMLNTIAKAANFTIEYSISEKIEDWGSILENGTSTGLFEALLKEKVQMAVGTLAATVNRFKYFDPSVPYTTDRITWCVPSASLKPKWLNVFNIFQLTTYFLITVTFLILCFVTRVISELVKESSYYSNTNNCFLHIYAVFLGMSLRLKPLYSSTRITFFMCAVLNLVIAAIYQTSLISFLTNPTYEKQIDTVDEMFENDLEILYMPQTRLYFSSDNNDWRMEKIVSKMIPCPNAHICLHKIAHGRNATIATPSLFLNYDLNRLVAKDGRLLVYWFKENFVTYPVHVYMIKGFPLKSRINSLIVQIVQSGLQDKWEQDLQYLVNKKNSAINKDDPDDFDDDEDKPQLLTLDQLQGAFFILLTGLTISLIVFIAELIVFETTKKKVLQKPTVFGPEIRNYKIIEKRLVTFRQKYY